MRRLTIGACALPLVLTLLVGWGASAEPPASASSYDAFDAVTLNEEDPAGTEIPYTGSDELFVVTPAFDTSTFTLQAGEAGGATNRNGCVLGPGEAAYAGRTAWVRFDPDVDGLLLVRALTPGYDSVLVLYETADRPWGSVDLSHLTSVDCDASADGPGNEEVGACFTAGEVPCLQARARSTYYIQVGGRCASSTDPATCSDPSVPGGTTRIELRFVPDDSDGDGVPDTADACPGTPDGTAVNSTGCPDQDGDEVADAEDECPTIPGNPDLAGCPDGPTPPPGEVGVVILSDPGGDTFTTKDATVRLGLVWPQGATSFIASNNGRDYSAPQPLQATVPWTLEDSERAVTRQVSVKFRGQVFDPENQYTSTILLDPDAPQKREALAARTWNGRYAVRLRLSDGAGSGVRTVRLGGRSFTCQKTAGRDCRSYGLSRQFGSRVRTFKAIDYAGNGLTNATVRRVLCPQEGQLPVYRYPQYRNSVPYGCFRIGQRITRKAKVRHDFPSVNLRTVKVDPGVFRVRKG